MQEKENKIDKNRWLILLIVAMQPFMACLDSSIVNVALPVMSKNLSVSMASIEWVVTSYLIVISATILTFGRMGDMKGKAAVFKFGLVLFTVGSLLCGISNSLSFLVFARIIQAIGAAGTMATNQGIITHVFPQNERGRALGISGTFVALGTMVGPPLGGLIVSVLSWQYIFLINVPVGIVTFILGMKVLPKTDTVSEGKLDIKGVMLFSAAVVLLFGAMTRGQEIGYQNPMILLAFVFAVICSGVFIWWEKRVKAPLLQLTLFENKLFSISVLCAFIAFTAIGSINIIQPFFLQDVLKLSPGVTGLFMMAYPLILSVVAPASGYLSDKIGSELLTFIGLVFTSIGLVFMSTLNEHATLGIMLVFVATLSIGSGLFQSPNTSLIMSTAPRDRLGIAGSINALVRNLGIVFGVSLSTTLLYNRMSYKIGYRVTNYIQGRDDVFIYGMRTVYITTAVICMGGAVLTALRLYRKNKSAKTGK